MSSFSENCRTDTSRADVPAPQDPNAAAAPTAKVPTAEKETAAKWGAWKSQQKFTGPDAKADSANPEQMNHFQWYEAHDWTKPYPGESEIVTPDQVPGAYIPSSENDG